MVFNFGEKKCEPYIIVTYTLTSGRVVPIKSKIIQGNYFHEPNNTLKLVDSRGELHNPVGLIREGEHVVLIDQETQTTIDDYVKDYVTDAQDTPLVQTRPSSQFSFGGIKMNDTIRIYLTSRSIIVADKNNISNLGVIVAAEPDAKGNFVSKGYTKDQLGEGYALLEKNGKQPTLVYVNDVVDLPEKALYRIEDYRNDPNAADLLREIAKEYGPADYGFETVPLPRREDQETAHPSNAFRIEKSFESIIA